MPSKSKAGSAARNDPLSELRSLSDRWFQAWLKKEAATVERLAAEDYLYVGPSGAILDRLAILNVVRSPSYRLDHGTRSEVVVRALGREAALVRHRYRGAGSFEGTSFTDDQRCVMIWEKLAGEWRLVMEQCSLSSEGPG
ncbi:MAG TPA: nuclear transport factor 2 family protein [Candidatus Eisenbacteria bacterium]|nr:nuclear transport factor 2 family protein [Candidatus Eisenbacteria bacterium]